MSLTPDHRSFENGETHSQKLRLKNPAARDSERVDEPIKGVSHHDLIGEGIKAILEPLNEQLSTLTQLLNQLTQKDSARISERADPRTHQTESRPSANDDKLFPMLNSLTKCSGANTHFAMSHDP